MSCDAGMLLPSCYLGHQILAMERERDFDVILCVTDRSIIPEPLLDIGIRYLEVEPGMVFEDLPNSELITPAAYLRLVVIDLLKDDYHRLLYVDGDIVLRRPGLGELLAAPMEHAVYAAPDAADFRADKTYEHYTGPLGLKPEFFYRNSGVLLVDSKAAAETKVMQRVLDYAQANHDKLVHHDQSALNGALKDDLGLLSLRWNFQVIEPLMDWIDRIDPVLLHFVGRQKPWRAPEGSIRHVYRRGYDTCFIDHGVSLPVPPARISKSSKSARLARIPGKIWRYLTNPAKALRAKKQWQDETGFEQFEINETRLQAILDAKQAL